MNLYSNFECEGVPCRLVVDFDERAVTRAGNFLHRLTAEVNGETLVERLEIAPSNLTRVVGEYRDYLIQIAKIISDPESDETVKWLRSNAFSFSDINARPTELNTTPKSEDKGSEYVDEY